MTSMVCALLIIGSVSSLAWIKNGLPERPQFASKLFANVDISQEKAKRFQHTRDLCRDKQFLRKGCISSEKPNVLVLGNSFAVDGVNVLFSVFQNNHNYIYSQKGSCPPFTPATARQKLNPKMEEKAKCLKILKKRFSPDYYKDIDYVYISNLIQKDYFGVEELKTYIEFLHDNNIRKIIVSGNHVYLREAMFSAGQRHRSITDVVKAFTYSRFDLNEELAALCQEMGCFFLDKKSLMCVGGHCKYEMDGVPFIWDRTHLSYAYARYIGKQAAEQITTYINLP